MPLYEFRCESGHVRERALSMHSEERSIVCPECGGESSRLISAPGLSRLGSARARAIGAAEASAHAPAVVDRVPGAGSRRSAPVTRDPRHAKLPRP
ncbi:FmdB family zinc ribbon protein [Brachybacterium hainanense]|uniref:FmdB family zinc ribbon protein n=1 Tax=Brachybacterium hainanense TaxID=1541174 RepID=A0ABV6RAZ7_9MICO